MRRVVLAVLPGVALAQSTISWVGGDVNWFETEINWSPALPGTSNGGIVQITNGADVTVDSAARATAATFKLADSGGDVTKLIVSNNLCIGVNCPDPGSTYLRGDPHITFAHGGQADFRGSHRASYVFVSSPGFQFAPYFQETDFWYARPELGIRQLVHGTFMTRASWRVRTNKGTELIVSADAMAKGEARIKIHAASSTGGETESVNLKPWSEHKVDDVRVATQLLSASVETPTWTVNVTSKPIYGLVQPVINETHVHGRWLVDQRRFDIIVHGTFPQPDAHGIVGQSYIDETVHHGRLDDYDIEKRPELATSEGMLPPFTTVAQAEGAIEGVHTDYKLPSPFSTDFKFSMYNKKPTPRTSTGKPVKRTASATEFLESKGWGAPKKEL